LCGPGWLESSILFHGAPLEGNDLQTPESASGNISTTAVLPESGQPAAAAKTKTRQGWVSDEFKAHIITLDVKL
jgi:hypothetical protein